MALKSDAMISNLISAWIQVHLDAPNTFGSNDNARSEAGVIRSKGG
jgi:hypothetical protein